MAATMNPTGFLVILLVILTTVFNLAVASPVRRSSLDDVAPISQIGWVVPLDTGSTLLRAPNNRTLKALAIGRGTITYTCAQTAVAFVPDARSDSDSEAIPRSDDGNDFVPDANIDFVPSRRATESTFVPSFIPDAVPSSDDDNFVPSRRAVGTKFVPSFIPDAVPSSDDDSFVPSRRSLDSSTVPRFVPDVAPSFVPDAVPSSIGDDSDPSRRDPGSIFIPDAIPSSHSGDAIPNAKSKFVPSRARDTLRPFGPKFVSASAELYDVAPVVQFMPQLEDLRKFTAAFAKYSHGSLPNSTLDCIGHMNLGTDKWFDYEMTIDNADVQIDTRLYKNVSAPSPEKNFNWSQAFSVGDGYEVYMVETAGGSAPSTCKEQPEEIVVTFAAEFWFYV